MEAATFGAEVWRTVTEYMQTIGRLFPTDVFLPDAIPTPLRARRASFRRRWTHLIRSIIAVRRKAERADAPRDLFDLLAQAHTGDREDLLVDEVASSPAVRVGCRAGDRGAPLQDGMEYARRLRAPLRVIADCGHLLIGERPDAVVDAVQEFLTRISDPTTGYEAFHAGDGGLGTQ